MAYVSGSSADGLTIGSGDDSLEVISGGVVTNTTILGNGDGSIDEGGLAIDTSVTGSGLLQVSSGGTTEGTQVTAGGDEQVSGGTADATVAGIGGEQDVFSGTAENTQVSGGLQYVLAGSVTGAMVSAGGLQLDGFPTIVVLDGPARVDGTTVGSGGTQFVTSEGPLTTYVSAGAIYATLTSSAGTTVFLYGPQIPDLAGYEIREVQDGGEVFAYLIAPDGSVAHATSATGYVALPAIVTNTTVLSGGTLQFGGGTATGVNALPGAMELIGGTTTVSGLTLNFGTVRAYNNTVTDGVTETVASNGIAISSILKAGGIEDITSGGVASGTSVLDGGFQYVEAGGTVSGGTVASGGIQYIEAGATASDVQVLSGGTQYDLSGGTDDNTKVSAGGTLYVSSGGGETNVDDGGTEVILPGGSGGGIKIDNSGVLSFSDSTATGANTVYAGGVTVFTGSATAGTAGFQVQAANGTVFVSSARAEISAGLPFPRLTVADFTTAMNGAVLFQDDSTAGAATINVSSGGVAWFEDRATAGSATITGMSGAIGFTGSSTADHSTIELDGGPGAALFVDSSTAGGSTITLSATATSGGALIFGNSATAGSATINNFAANADVGGIIAFAGNSTAGGATINNQAQTTTALSRALSQITTEFLSSYKMSGSIDVAVYKAEQAVAMFPNDSPVPIGGLLFFDSSTAGSATISNTSQGLVDFFDGSAAGATIVNSGGGASQTVAPLTVFYGGTAGSASITNEDGGSTVFAAGGNGGGAQISNQSGGLLVVGSNSYLGSATINDQSGAGIIGFGGSFDHATITDGGAIVLVDGTLGDSNISVQTSAFLVFGGHADGGNAAVTTADATATVDLSGAESSSVAIGSIAGAGLFALGGNKLQVGSANTDTTVTGIVTNGGLVNSVTGINFSGVTTIGGEATLDKVGTGTLTLSGTVNQTNLIVEKGRLVVDGPVTGSSTALIMTAGTLELGSASAEGVTFAAAANGTLVLDDPLAYTGAVGGFAIGQTIVISAPALPGATATVVPSGSGASITVVDGAQVFSVALADASLVGAPLSVSGTPAGQLAVTLSATVVSTTLVVGAGETISNLVIVSGGTVTVQDGGTISTVVVNSGGHVIFDAGATGIHNVVNDGGQEDIDDGATVNGIRVADPGELMVSSGGTASATQVVGGHEDVYGSAASDMVASGGVQAVQAGGTATGTQVGSGGTLVLAGGAAGGVQLAIGGAIDFATVTFVPGSTASVAPATDLLTVSGTAASLQLAGNYAMDSFLVASDGGAGTLVTAAVANPACYCAGTLIATPTGEVEVERLAIGDLVLTVDGRAKPVHWIGHRSYAGRFLAANPGVQPIHFIAGSLGEGLPRRDLLVSPDHAMLLDGLLVPARCLVDGSTITQLRQSAVVRYVHIELKRHDVIFAEGAASETFVDDGSRGMFHNASDYAERYPRRRTGTAEYYAPRVTHGFELETIRQRIATLTLPAPSAA